MSITLANTRSLAAQLAKVVKLGAPYVTFLHDVDVIDYRRVQRKNPLYADAKTHLAHGDGLAHSAMLAGDNHALKSLQALFRLRFLDAHKNPNRIAGLKFRNVVA